MKKPDEESFTKLVVSNRASIYRICRAYIYDASLADDLYQEILFQIWKSIKSFKGNARVSTWVYRIAVNTAISFNLKNKRHQHEPIPEFFSMAYEDTMEEKKETEVRLDHLRYCINQLEPADRLIISLVLEDKSYKDIAEITGNNANLVGVKINRIKSRLLKLMSTPQHHEL